MCVCLSLFQQSCETYQTGVIFSHLICALPFRFRLAFRRYTQIKMCNSKLHYQQLNIPIIYQKLKRTPLYIFPVHFIYIFKINFAKSSKSIVSFLPLNFRQIVFLTIVPFFILFERLNNFIIRLYRLFGS